MQVTDPTTEASICQVQKGTAVDTQKAIDIRETQEMLDFCHEHGLTADVEVIGIGEIDAAYDRMARGDFKYRFSIDMETLKQGPEAAGG